MLKIFHDSWPSCPSFNFFMTEQTSRPSYCRTENVCLQVWPRFGTPLQPNDNDNIQQCKARAFVRFYPVDGHDSSGKSLALLNYSCQFQKAMTYFSAWCEDSTTKRGSFFWDKQMYKATSYCTSMCIGNATSTTVPVRVYRYMGHQEAK